MSLRVSESGGCIECILINAILYVRHRDGSSGEVHVEFALSHRHMLSTAFDQVLNEGDLDEHNHVKLCLANVSHNSSKGVG